MSDQMLLVEMSKDWDDEFVVNGFRVMTDTEWERHKKLVRRDKEDAHIELYFGTNQALEFLDANDYIDAFTVTEISDEEADTFRRFFGRTDEIIEGGIFPFYETDEEDVDEDDEDNERENEDEDL